MAKITDKKSKIIPLGDRVLVRPFTEEDLKKSMSGIIIPDTVSKEKSAQGKVLEVGPGRYLEGKLVPVGVRSGDTVFFSKYGYDEVELDGEELYLIREENILAILRS